MRARSLRVGVAYASFAALTLTLAPPALAAPTAAAAPAALPANLEISSMVPEDDGKPYPRQNRFALEPYNPSDASIGRGAIPFHEIAPRANSWLTSQYVSTEVVGHSTQGRPFYMVTITAPETAEQSAQQDAWRDEIKYDSANAATNQELKDGYKKPVWFNNNIHGNEWDGTDASIDYIEELLADLAAGDAEALELVQDYRLYFTLTNNPDGRVLGTRATAVGLDPNRDFITNTTPETSVVRDLTADIQPLFFIDLHGYTTTLQVEPTGPPQGENYEHDLLMPHAYAAALRIEEDYKATGLNNQGFPTRNGGINIPYRDIPSGWDGWPPIFTAQYVQFQGAISYTVEFGPGRVSNLEQSRRNLAHNVEVGNMVLSSTLAYIQENEEELVENQIEIFRRGAAGEPLRDIPANPDPANYPGPDQWAPLWDAADVTGTEFPRAYVIPAGERQSSDSDAARLVEQLLVHGVLVEQTDVEATIDGVTYPAGSYVVDLHQPLRGLANVILADGSDISDRVPSMYDISAWSMGRLWGATVDRIGSTGDPALEVATTPITDATLSSTIDDGAYLSLRLDGLADVQALNEMLALGLTVTSVGDGSYVVGPEDRTAAAAVATEFGSDLVAVDGRVVEAPGAKGLTPLRVGYTGSNGTGDTYLSLVKMGFTDPVFVNNTFTDYDSIDVLFASGNLTFNTTAPQAAAKAAFDSYIAGGGGFVANAAGVALGATSGVFSASRATGASGANGIVLVDTPADGVLGATSEPAAFFSGPSYFTALGENVTVEQTWGTYLSGHWRPSGAAGGPAQFVGQPSAISAVGATGSKAFVFATSPLYRTHPIGAFPDVAAALYWAGPAGEGVLGPLRFADVPRGAQFFDEITWLSDAGVSTGWETADGEREFRPLSPVARDAMAAFLYRLSDSPEYTAPEVSPFVDVPVTNQFYKEIAWLASEGVSLGWETPAGAEFRPLDPINRDAMAAFLFRLADVEGYPAPTTAPFADVAVDAQFATEIAWVAEQGIATGWASNDGTQLFQPVVPIARDAIAAFLYRFEHLGSEV